MIADSEQLISGMVKSVRAQVGTSLSTLPKGTLASVIKSEQGGTRPDYPYIVVSEMTDDKIGGWLKETYIDDDNITHYLSEQTVNLMVKCYGDNAQSILRTLRAYAVDDLTRYNMNEECQAIFVEYSGITREPEFLQTDFINAAYIIATFTVVSDLNIDTGVIERVTGEGRYLRYEGDEDPFVDNFDVDSTS